MLKRLGSHVRHNVVAYLALFFAIGVYGGFIQVSVGLFLIALLR